MRRLPAESIAAALPVFFLDRFTAALAASARIPQG
jgi:hypothetical protein